MYKPLPSVVTRLLPHRPLKFGTRTAAILAVFVCPLPLVVSHETIKKKKEKYKKSK